MNFRFPRLGAAKARLAIARLVAMSREETEVLLIPRLNSELFAATGVPKVTTDVLGKMRGQLQQVIREAGYPHTSLATRQSVDRALAIDLVSMNLPVGEMLRPDVWAWLAVHLLPEYVHWRWVKDKKVTEERFSGPVVRNALGRLWLRGWVFDLGVHANNRWEVVNALPEDGTVALLERTSVSSDHRLSRTIAQTWLNTKGMSEQSLRDAMVRARINAALVDSSVLSDAELQERTRKLLSAYSVIDGK